MEKILLWLQAIMQVIKILVELGVIKQADAEKVAWQVIKQESDSHQV